MRKLAFVSVLCFTVALGHSATFEASAWRGETAYVSIPEALQDDAAAISSDAAGEGVSFTLLRFDEVKYDTFERYTDKEGKKKVRVTGKGTVSDVCREWKKGDKTFPTMIKVTVAPDAKPGKRTVKLGERGGDSLALTVVDRVLPPAKDWKYFLDLWQHPWAVSRYFNVKPFSKEHYAKMEPVWRALAESGCKALTVTLLDLPWNNQCLDGYYSMIGRVKKADGRWEFDYTIFDEYVEFGRKCGLGPDIACYTMCPWGYRVSWKEEVRGNGLVERREKYLPGTAEFENYWGDFLVDFKKHLEAKGWFNDAYIAMDERSPEDVKKIIAFIQKKAPGMKVAMAGNKSPSEFSGMNIDNYCQGLIHLRKHPKLLDELEPRRQKGFKTTFYVCATAMHPNTFMDSPADEGFWLGAYPGITGFDGFLRWAANSWPKDPYDDASFKTVRRGNLHWRPGDTFLIYPRGELSSRLISLRAGVIAAEKMRILKEGERIPRRPKGGVAEGDALAGVEAVEKALKKLGEPYGYKGAVNNAFDFSAFRRAVEEFVNK